MFKRLTKLGGVFSLKRFVKMDNESLDVIDILAYTTQELQEEFRAKPNQAEQTFQNFLRRWEADEKLNAVKNMKIEFPKDLDWFNVSRPLTTEELKGKIVILDFFTFCCINCMHLLPELHELEVLFPPERGLAVIGVHSPKFENERDSSNLLAAVQRYEIEHPVVNDPRSLVWRAVGIHCWPSLLVLSPAGQPMLLLMGEGHGNFLERFVENALRYFQAKNEIQTQSLPMNPSKNLLPASNLCFPAKIARSKSEQFCLADAGNHRILLFNRKGEVLHKIGGNTEGFVDGDFESARFNSPQGVDFLDENTLIVADTKNHALRQICLKSGQVTTLAGTGQQGNDRVGGKVGSLQAIGSPWDVAVFHTRDMDMSFHPDEKTVPEKPIVLISMAGTHQIWGYFPAGVIWWKFRKYEPLTCVALIGTGHEENRNNSYPQNAAFAQPSGIAIAKDFLFISDSESSSIRKASLLDGKVLPVVGGDRNPLNLFAFGDIDGKQFGAKLQHPLAVAYNSVNDKVYVADTYNHKIKVIDTAANKIETLLIKGENGKKFLFKEPAGLCFDASGQYLLVANTNNHDLRIVDMNTLIVKPFPLDFNQTTGTVETDSAVSHSSIKLLRQLPLRTCKQFKLQLKLHLSEGLKFTDSAPQKYVLKVSNSSLLPSSLKGRFDERGTAVIQLQRSGTKEVVPTNANEAEEIHIDLTLNLCNQNCCLMRRFTLTLHDEPSQETEKASVSLQENININVLAKNIEIN